MGPFLTGPFHVRNLCECAWCAHIHADSYRDQRTTSCQSSGSFHLLSETASLISLELDYIGQAISIPPLPRIYLFLPPVPSSLPRIMVSAHLALVLWIWNPILRVRDGHFNSRAFSPDPVWVFSGNTLEPLKDRGAAGRKETAATSHACVVTGLWASVPGLGVSVNSWTCCTVHQLTGLRRVLRCLCDSPSFFI